KTKEIINLIDQYDSFEDEPWVQLYRLADVMYPEAKFILTIRKDSDTWFNSLVNHCDRILFNEHRKFVFGTMYPRERKNEIIGKYEQHNSDVIDYFKGRGGKLLVISFDGENKVDALEKICEFLGCEKPRMPVPQKNAAPKKIYPKQ